MSLALRSGRNMKGTIIYDWEETHRCGILEVGQQGGRI
jgi:hypothetical protein